MDLSKELIERTKESVEFSYKLADWLIQEHVDEGIAITAMMYLIINNLGARQGFPQDKFIRYCNASWDFFFEIMAIEDKETT